jgi:xylulokinase
MLYIGIDLGTSAVKLLLKDGAGKIQKIISREYPISFPRYGLVVLDKDDRVLRPAILWNDGRTAEETEYLNSTVGRDALTRLTANIAFAGFTAPKLLWMKKHEPALYARIDKIMLPKDYINYMLTGIHSTDYSDASGTLLLDVEHKCWSAEMLELCSVSKAWLPRLYESFHAVGTLTKRMADVLGLRREVKVAAGAGDNAAAAIGTATVSGLSDDHPDCRCNISVGTSGTVFIASDTFRVDRDNALHAFAHADGAYHLMGCMLSAAACNKWWAEDILRSSLFEAEQAPIGREKLGRSHVYFMPYLMGERSPHNDSAARGAFIGLSMDTSRADLTQAVLVGVAFALRDSIEVARSMGLVIRRSKICGGGAKSALWKEILANVLNLDLECVETEEGPGYGGAILAAVACKEYPSVQEAAEKLVKATASVKPDAEIAARYEERYQLFRRLYPALKPLYRDL